MMHALSQTGGRETPAARHRIELELVVELELEGCRSRILLPCDQTGPDQVPSWGLPVTRLGTVITVSFPSLQFLPEPQP